MASTSLNQVSSVRRRKTTAELIGQRVSEMFRSMRLNKTAYLFIAPYATLFTLFYVLPVVVSIYLSFTYFNVLEAPRWIGWTNYLNLFLNDDIFLKAVKNTLLFALITGPIGYIASFMFAWFINEIPPKIRAFVVLIFYAPSISGQVFMIWTVMFSGDRVGYVNSILLRLGVIYEPILWLQDEKYMFGVVVLVILWLSLGTSFLAFIGGLQTIDNAMYEAGSIDGVKNRWQELWYLTLPAMRNHLMFGAVMSITGAFAISDVTTALAGFPSANYAVHTVVNHLSDYGQIRFEMGYASAIATILFIVCVTCNKLIQKFLRRVGT